jgi:hypothetical protein
MRTSLTGLALAYAGGGGDCPGALPPPCHTRQRVPRQSTAPKAPKWHYGRTRLTLSSRKAESKATSPVATGHGLMLSSTGL